jgi:hypothetical protein
VTTLTRTLRTRLVRSASAVLLAGGVVVGLTACGEGSMVDNIVGSAVDQGVESVRGTVEDAMGDVLGGASVSTDGFATAQTQLEGAGYTASGVNVDGDTALGTFTGATYRVLLTLTTQSSDGAVVATYVVTPL